MTLATRSILLKSLLAVGVVAGLSGCVSDGYGTVGYYGGGMNGRHMYTHWDRHMHGNRCLTAYGSCNRFYHGYYYENPWWTMSY